MSQDNNIIVLNQEADEEEMDLLTNYLYSRFLTCEFNQIFKK